MILQNVTFAFEAQGFAMFCLRCDTAVYIAARVLTCIQNMYIYKYLNKVLKKATVSSSIVHKLHNKC